MTDENKQGQIAIVMDFTEQFKGKRWLSNKIIHPFDADIEIWGEIWHEKDPRHEHFNEYRGSFTIYSEVDVHENLITIRAVYYDDLNKAVDGILARIKSFIEI